MHKLVLLILIFAAVFGTEVRSQSDQPTVYILESFTGDTTGFSLSSITKLSSHKHDELLSSVVGLATAKGYYFARASVVSVERSPKEDTVRLSAHLWKGPRVKVRDIVYHGISIHSAGKLKQRFIGSDSALTPEFISEVELGARSVSFASFLAPVEIQFLTGYTEAVLVVRFVKPKPFTLSAGGGYRGERNEGVGWQFNVRARNVLGEGREAGVRGERSTSDRMNLEVDYGQLMNFRGPGRIEARVATRDYREQFYEFKSEVSYSYIPSAERTFSLLVGAGRVEDYIDRDGYSRYVVGIGAGHAERTLTRGSSQFSAVFDALYTRRNYREAGSYHDIRTDVQATWTQSISQKFSLRANGRYVGLETKQELVPMPELYQIGGVGTLRGYRTEQFIVDRALLGSVELHFWLGASSLYGFTDAGLLSHWARTSDAVSDFEQGAGIGFLLSGAHQSADISVGWGRTSTFSQPHVSVRLTANL